MPIHRYRQRNPPRNISASINQGLLNVARNNSIPTFKLVSYSLKLLQTYLECVWIFNETREIATSESGAINQPELSSCVSTKRWKMSARKLGMNFHFRCWKKVKTKWCGNFFSLSQSDAILVLSLVRFNTILWYHGFSAINNFFKKELSFSSLAFQVLAEKSRHFVREDDVIMLSTPNIGKEVKPELR